jgi:hypothetical protein
MEMRTRAARGDYAAIRPVNVRPARVHEHDAASAFCNGEGTDRAIDFRCKKGAAGMRRPRGLWLATGYDGGAEISLPEIARDGESLEEADHVERLE